MRQFYKVTLYDDSPAANPKSITFDIATESAEDARQRGKRLAALIYDGHDRIAVHARLCSKTGAPEAASASDEESKRLTRFKAIHLDRVIKEVGPHDYLKIPSGRGWFDKAECFMTRTERAKMALLGIPFDVVTRVKMK